MAQLLPCPTCNKEISENAHSCPHCGEDFMAHVKGLVPCRSCGHQVSQNALKCPQCGEDVREKKYCLSCHNQIPENALGCPHCAAELLREREEMKAWDYDMPDWVKRFFRILPAVIIIMSIFVLGELISRCPGSAMPCLDLILRGIGNLVSGQDW